MKRISLLLSVLVFFLLVSTVHAQRERGREHRRENPEARFEHAEHELELQERRAELEFQQQMREIKLGKLRRDGAVKRRRCQDAPKRMMRKPGGAPQKLKSCHGKSRSGCSMSSGKRHHPMKIICPLMLLLIMIVHILLAVWVYKDIRKKNSESGVWIVIALITGLLGTAVYAIVRLENTKK